MTAEADRPNLRRAWRRTVAREAPLFLALVVVGGILGGLLVGYEPVGGDPDRLYRPLKSELARALHEGRLPFWSDRFGLGVPLVAESHVAAFYPPNLVLYSLSTSRRPIGSRCGCITWRSSPRPTATPAAWASRRGEARWPAWRSLSVRIPGDPFEP